MSARRGAREGAVPEAAVTAGAPAPCRAARSLLEGGGRGAVRWRGRAPLLAWAGGAFRCGARSRRASVRWAAGLPLRLGPALPLAGRRLPSCSAARGRGSGIPGGEAHRDCAVAESPALRGALCTRGPVWAPLPTFHLADGEGNRGPEFESVAQCDTQRELELKCKLLDARAPVLIPHFAGRLGPGPLPTSHDSAPSPLHVPASLGLGSESGAGPLLRCQAWGVGRKVAMWVQNPGTRRAGEVEDVTCGWRREEWEGRLARLREPRTEFQGRARCQMHFPQRRDRRPIPQHPFPPAFLAQKVQKGSS